MAATAAQSLQRRADALEAARQAPLAEALLANPEPERPHKAVCDLFQGHQEYIAVDIETHALVEQTRTAGPMSKKARGDADLVVFDRTSCGNARDLRCVQISVVRGRLSDEAPLVQEWLVRPEGFDIGSDRNPRHRGRGGGRQRATFEANVVGNVRSSR